MIRFLGTNLANKYLHKILKFLSQEIYLKLRKIYYLYE